MRQDAVYETELVTLSVHDYRTELARDVAAGLTGEPKSIPSKYFYDERGAALFERITTLPEYYLTRAELRLIDRFGADLIRRSDPAELLELGSGSADKICRLLEAGGAGDIAAYAGLDVNPDSLASAGQVLAERFPEIEMRGLVGDFFTDLDKVPRSEGPRLILFLGSTIGNLGRRERVAFLGRVAAMMAAADSFLLGIDLVKDVSRLCAAYDDGEKVTAEFTRNVLRVVNRELGADFDVSAFEHVPRWNAQELRMEAWLRASRPMRVRVARLGLEVEIAAGEEIHTEVSCKFTREMVESELASAGIAIARWITDESAEFALVLGRLARA